MSHDLTLTDVMIWDPRRGGSEARWTITIRDGRIDRVDAGAAPRPMHGGEVLAGEGRRVVPGFVDAHLHLLMGGLHLTCVDLSGAASREAFEEAIAHAHRTLPVDRWLIGVGWNESLWGGTLPDASWLRHAGDRPAVCHRCDLHAALVNGSVMEQIGAPLAADDPPGGAIVRTPGGHPTGLLLEAAAWEYVNAVIPEPPVEQRREALHRACTYLLSLGVTTVGTMEYAADVREVILPARHDLPIRLRVTLLDRSRPFDVSVAEEFHGDDALAVIGCKAFLDGTIGSRTARMLAPYADAPASRGLLVELAASGHLMEWAQCVADAGLQPSMHAIGDEAVRMALDVLDALGPRADQVRARIEHAQQVHPDDVRRFQGRIASMQPYHAYADTPGLSARLGPERAAQAYPFRSLLNAGAVLAFGSDWPVVRPDPLDAIRSAVTGLDSDRAVRRPAERLSLDEAFRAHTLDAARALHVDDAGVIGPGAAGDLVVFEDDPFETDWLQGIPGRHAVITAGRIVYPDAGAIA